MLSLFALVVTLSGTPEVYADSRDDRTLLVQKLVNRNLPGQLDAYRLGRDLGRFTAAADLLLNFQASLSEEPPTPFHGFFYMDTYLAVEAFDSIDVNLNLLIFNKTASGGFRVLSEVLPGLSAHFHPQLGRWGGHPIELDVLALDLDVTTIGHGLLLETVPLEGVLAGLRWNDLEFRFVFGGRVFWPQDDLLSATLTAYDGRVGVGYSHWFTTSEGVGVDSAANYAHVFGRWSPAPLTTVAAEYMVRLDAPHRPAHALLGRVDFVYRTAPLSFHAGYQFRWYEPGSGPFDVVLAPSTIPNTPDREDYYATNSFEYLWLSPVFEQWSHTGMFEAIWHMPPFETFAELEVWLRFSADREQTPPRVIRTLEGDRLPGQLTTAFYRVGLRLYPVPDLPYRFIVYVSNKSVSSLRDVREPEFTRFINQPVFSIEAEARL